MSTPSSSAELVRELALKAGRRRVFAVLVCAIASHTVHTFGSEPRPVLASAGGHVRGFDSPVGQAGFTLNGAFFEPSELLYNPHASVSISGSHVPCVHVVADLVCGLTLDPAHE